MFTYTQGSFDSSVHISEEASNAATAVPWSIVCAIAIGGILGWGKNEFHFAGLALDSLLIYGLIAINVALAFCMGPDLQALASSPQPMAQIFLNSFGQKGALGLWVLAVMIQYVVPLSIFDSSVEHQRSGT